MIVNLALPLILAFIMFSLGLGLRKADFERVLKYPAAFGLGLSNQVILLPLVAFALAYAFSLPPIFAVGLMILAFCPGGVTSNVLAKLAGGNAPLSISLTAVTSLLSIITVPILVALSVKHFMGESGPQVNVTKLGVTMFLITAVRRVQWTELAAAQLEKKVIRGAGAHLKKGGKRGANTHEVSKEGDGISESTTY